MSEGQSPPIFTLPLFPLHCVLFPHLPLHLHIFEERYKAMINGCIERSAPFGVVLIREGEETGEPAQPYDVGCIAQILGVERLEDGRMNLLAAGERRFRLLEYTEADLPYLIGRVEELTDVPTPQEDAALLTAELSAMFVRYLSLLASQVGEPMPEIELPDDPTILSFCVAAVAMLPPLEKQRLLEMTATCERIEAELTWLREQIHELQTEGGESAPVHILVARPLDIESDRWQNYLHETRN